jgi:hypothetical protein
LWYSGEVVNSDHVVPAWDSRQLGAKCSYMKSVDDYCKILGVDTKATSKELKKAYRGLVKKWHPDQFLHDPHRLKSAKEKLQEINEAYHALQLLILDPKNRLSQSSKRSSQRNPAPPRKTNGRSVKMSNAPTKSFVDMHFASWRKPVALLRRVLIETVKDPWIITVFILMLTLAIAMDWFY